MKEFDLESLNLYITNGVTVDSEYETVKTGFGITPDEFLRLAKSDLTASYDNHLLNSLTNTKRAIDSQLDSLLIGLGLFKKSKKERWRFPKKIEFLNDMGIISPKILNKINKKRNLLEHEYKNPIEEEVEDALDVAELFVEYTDKYLSPALVHCELLDRELRGETYDEVLDLNMGVQYVNIKLDWKNCKLILTHSQRINSKVERITAEIKADQIEYEEYLKFYLNLYNVINR
ncbi:hypothetical protein [Methanosarcina sp.]|uniref:hypothetical protein n=1 Tax=Methanosarcina sp. TaxID=2213 RepID=UPI003C78EE06